ncbi:MAG: hypothetical protein OWS03_13260 [Alicyclobacillaceae bacterium]|nr:hypothetical protein [Alicyclobacillaceae bacterium]
MFWPLGRAKRPGRRGGHRRHLPARTKRVLLASAGAMYVWLWSMPTTDSPYSLLVKPVPHALGAIRSSARQPFAMRDSTVHESFLAQNSATEQSLRLSPGVPVQLRPFPYPYRAMLAICSDADHQTLRKFNEIHRFLNTKANTPYGPGLGLDVADSFFLYNGSNDRSVIDVGGIPLTHQLAYFRGTTGTPYAAEAIDHFLRVGWMDSMHSYGDFSTRSGHDTSFHRRFAKVAHNVWQSRHAPFVSVWIDHGNTANVDNFGSRHLRSFFHYQQGAVPSSPYYHTDITRKFGVRYVWSDFHSQQFGARSVLSLVTLPDGQKMYGFSRYTNDGVTKDGAVHWLWSVKDLDAQLSIPHLRHLVQINGYVVVAQHLASDSAKPCLPPDAVQSLRTLANWQTQGKILVARTSRLLAYNAAHQSVRFTVTEQAGQTTINILTMDDPVFGKHVPCLAELRGLTFYTAHPDRTTILCNGRAVLSQMIVRNPSDGISPSIGVRWYRPYVKDASMTLPRVP